MKHLLDGLNRVAVGVVFLLAALVVTPAASQDLNADLARLEADAAERGAILGNRAGQTVLFEFFDYNCPYCRASYGDLVHLVQDYPDLKVVLVEHPILSTASREAARQALQLTGSDYIAVHRALFTRSGRATAARVLAEAERLEIAISPVDEENPPQETLEALANNAAIARRLGFTGVPGFRINGVSVNGRDFTRIEKALCGYSGRGSCSSYRVLLADAQAATAGGDRRGAQSLMARAVRDARRVRRGEALNSVCWQGALMDFARVVMPACDAAVAAEAGNAGYRDSRGLARALTGNRRGAIADFEFYIANAGQTRSAAAAARTQAIALLRGAVPPSNAQLIELLGD